MDNVTGKVAFITGGASGMGLAMARSFSAAGMKVVVADIEQAALDKVQAEFTASNADVMTLKVDVTDRDAMEAAAAATVERFGKVHVLVNNAGVAVAGRLDAMEYKDWDWVMGVNVNGVINGLQAFMQHIQSHGEGGHIVNTASMAGHMPVPGLGVYNASKYAVVGLSETLQADLADKNIGVSVLCPGVVATNIFDSGRNRPSELTGAHDNANLTGTLSGNPDSEPDSAGDDSPTNNFMDGALDAAVVGDMVLHAIAQNELYIFTHPELEAPTDDRKSAMTDAFARWRDYRQQHKV